MSYIFFENQRIQRYQIRLKRQPLKSGPWEKVVKKSGHQPNWLLKSGQLRCGGKSSWQEVKRERAPWNCLSWFYSLVWCLLAPYPILRSMKRHVDSLKHFVLRPGEWNQLRQIHGALSLFTSSCRGDFPPHLTLKSRFIAEFLVPPYPHRPIENFHSCFFRYI